MKSMPSTISSVVSVSWLAQIYGWVSQSIAAAPNQALAIAI
jgi:hypothetical protein